MGPRHMLPLLDLVFLTLGAIVAAMTQMERVTTLPVELARIGPGAAVVTQGDLLVITVDQDGAIALDGVPIAEQQIGVSVRNRTVVVRADRRLPSETLLKILAELSRADAEVSVQVDDQE